MNELFGRADYQPIGRNNNSRENTTMKKSKIAIILVSSLMINSLTTHAHGQNIQPTREHEQSQVVNQHHYPNSSSREESRQHQAPQTRDKKIKNIQQYPTNTQERNHIRDYEAPKTPQNRGFDAASPFARGDQLPERYRGNSGKRYSVVDWHNHSHLYEPPQNMRWSYIDGRYILATIATGVIYNIIYAG